MNEEEGLRQAVLAAPDDDWPRLVYADWLDDVGESGRAEFVRAQVELAQLAAWEPPAVRARHRRPELLTGAPWRNTLPALGTGQMADWQAEHPFRRGFGWGVHVRQMGAFLAMAPEIFAREPVGELVLPAAGRDDWEAFASSPWLARVSSLRFTTGSGLSEPIRALAASEFASKIDRIAFDVSTSPGMAAVVEALVQSSLGKQLKELEFRLGHDRDGDILQELAAAQDLKLERLTLTTMGHGAEALAHLGRLPNAEHLKSLAIRHQTTGGTVATVLAAGLQRFPLRQFAVLAGQLTGTDLLGFAERNIERSLRSLDFSENILNDDVQLLEVFHGDRFPNLRALQLRHCGLSDDALAALTAARFWNDLVELDLRGNRFSDAGLQVLMAVKPPRDLAALLLDDDLATATTEKLRAHFGNGVVFGA